jgi:hypothetical protein
MTAITVSSVAASPPSHRANDHHEKDDPNHPIQRSKEAGHRRLKVGDGNQRSFDDDRDRHQAQNSGQMGSIGGLHRVF